MRYFILGCAIMGLLFGFAESVLAVREGMPDRRVGGGSRVIEVDDVDDKGTEVECPTTPHDR